MNKADVIKHFGGVTKLARALQINRMAIYQWKSIPWMRQKQIELLTSGVLKADELPIPKKKEDIRSIANRREICGAAGHNHDISE
jgi:hypothetical protein